MAEPKRPTSGMWTQRPDVHLPPPCGCALVFEHALLIRVFSAVERDVDGEWFHVSISTCDRYGKTARASNAHVQAVRRDFGMELADEDNHVPGGKVRNLFLKVEGDTEPCDCKATEEPHDEGEGYVWRDAPEGGR